MIGRFLVSFLDRIRLLDDDDVDRSTCFFLTATDVSRVVVLFGRLCDLVGCYPLLGYGDGCRLIVVTDDDDSSMMIV